jgi:limonene-1,2-epoxide hydrolase
LSRTPDALVREFFELWASPKPTELAAYFTADGVYHNMPMGPVQGPQAIEQFIAGFMAEFDGMDIEVLHLVSNGNLVVTERVDVMRRKGGGELRLPVMGIFEIVDDRIAVWRSTSTWRPSLPRSTSRIARGSARLVTLHDVRYRQASTHYRCRGTKPSDGCRGVSHEIQTLDRCLQGQAMA